MRSRALFCLSLIILACVRPVGAEEAPSALEFGLGTGFAAAVGPGFGGAAQAAYIDGRLPDFVFRANLSYLYQHSDGKWDASRLGVAAFLVSAGYRYPVAPMLFVGAEAGVGVFHTLASGAADAPGPNPSLGLRATADLALSDDLVLGLALGPTFHFGLYTAVSAELVPRRRTLLVAAAPTHPEPPPKPATPEPWPAQADAEAAAPAPSGPRVVLLPPPVDLTEAPTGGYYAEVITTSLGVRLEEAGFRVKTAKDEVAGPDSAFGRLPPAERTSGPRMVDLARSGDERADIVIGSVYGIEGRRFVVNLKAYSVETGGLLGGEFASGFSGMPVFNLVDETVQSLLTDLEGTAAAAEQGFGAAPSAGPVTFVAAQDLALYFGGEVYGGSLADGRLAIATFGFQSNAAVHIEKRLDGHHSASETVQLEPGQSEYPLSPLWKKTILDWSFFSTLGQTAGLGVAFRWFPVPDQVFLQAENYFYVIPSATGGSYSVHNDIALAAGAYLFSSHDEPFRVYAQAGVGMIFSGLPDSSAPLYRDVYLNLVTFGFELNRPGWSLFLQSAVKYSLESGDGILDRDYLWVADHLPVLSVGLRLK